MLFIVSLVVFITRVQIREMSIRRKYITFHGELKFFLCIKNRQGFQRDSEVTFFMHLEYNSLLQYDRSQS